MTVSQIREYMLEKVIPEKVMPQNIEAILLSDGDAELPELDAFTFLNRLRALGIGSADFLYLLKGCGAPSEAVEQIQRDPAMNLQSLIVTLDGSGLKSQDYTRMLYTARQLWERTLTMRLDQMQQQEREGAQTADYVEDYSDSDIREYATEIAEDYSEHDAEQGADYLSSEEPPVDYSDAESYTEEQGAGAPVAITNADEIAAEPVEAAPTAEQEMPTVSDFAEDYRVEELAAGIAAEPVETATTAERDIPTESDFAEDYHAENLAAGIAAEPVETATTAERDIPTESDFAEDYRAEELAAGIAAEPVEAAPIAEQEMPTESDFAEDIPEEMPTAIQPAEDADEQPADTSPEDDKLNINARIYTETTQFLKADTAELAQSDPEYDNNDNEDESDADNANCAATAASAWHKGALVAGLVGAVCVTAAAFWAELADFGTLDSLHYAQSPSEIFAQIYSSYNNGVIGGESALEYSEPAAEFIGDTLVESLGSAPICFDGNVYFASDNYISVYTRENDKLISCGEIVPPDGAQFISIREENGAIYAIFSGDCGGAMQLSGSESVYIAAQDGILTDITFENGEIQIGTVYVPPFTKSFSADDVEEYLPEIGGALIDTTRVLLCGEEGCAYAAAGCYSAENGTLISAGAVIGDAVFACADGTAGLNTADGGIIVKPLDAPIACKTGRISAWARADGIFALAETQNAGAESPAKEPTNAADNSNATDNAAADTPQPNTRIYLRGEDLSALSAFENLARNPTALRLDGGRLIAESEGEVILCANCTDPSAPALISPEKLCGVVIGQSALCCEKTAAGIRLSLVCGGETLASFEKTLTSAELETLEFGAPQCAFAYNNELCGMAYSRFDGVSIVTEYAVFGKSNVLNTLYDDEVGYTAAACVDGNIFLFKGDYAEQLELG